MAFLCVTFGAEVVHKGLCSKPPLTKPNSVDLEMELKLTSKWRNIVVASQYPFHSGVFILYRKNTPKHSSK